jgi:hypothetical protein
MVKEGLTIEAVDNDGDYLGIEVRASNGRFAGCAWIYAGNDELSDFAAHITGFPASLQDLRSYEFGSPDQTTAGGYCSLEFRCLDRTGHVIVDVFLDGKLKDAPESARFSFKTEPSAIDQFVLSLRRVDNDRTGDATLHSDSVA